MKAHPEVKIWIGAICGIRSYGFWTNTLLDRLYKKYQKRIILLHSYSFWAVPMLFLDFQE